ncbi:formate acetyltransferase [Candidatus Peregrinibacteria bacterium CG22_combo_CG10-13_8_21_14_all_44_10]|nr:MAG: formate acetyltransferase [Candidatus Peregrinibacteria bacterium CG22_combo_CG10-13_8_21_14_all_44_10]PIS03704.1 MAG: formate acetyltransferase [Candidatus Peregrinibacteria bacterium CG10_big_fil_rev_8_21_14_0_10_44_7]PIX80426.1 MAG: formate acetyltransferase [Candidatus Peregrinibacteria bacterium CG_4_10_14_3_um_filter_44_21]PJB88408.1 MAG: formate acetyltransferase [Candidatus Peregrinibacteria bacterium CG_4_9_14_0_8_um_filter_44_15]
MPRIKNLIPKDPDKNIKIPKIHHAFKKGHWQIDVDVRNFIQLNYKPYKGDHKFLEKLSRNTKKVWKKIEKLQKTEFKRGGVYGIDTKTPSNIISHKPGYIDKSAEVIVGLQTDKPLVRAIKPKGGVRLVETACESYGYKLDPKVRELYSEHIKTHNDAVFDIYTGWKDFFTLEKHDLFRKKGIITGLPDNYGRGRIIGDYRRVALYGIDRLISEKFEEINDECTYMNEENMLLREEANKQIEALQQLKEMAASYGFDIGRPAEDTREAIQWTYFGYLGAVKEQDGAAMSFGRIDSFFDIYAERDLKSGKYTEKQIQEFVDNFVLKLRLVRHLRAPEYNSLFAGDPTWVTCVLGGMGKDGRPLVTKTSFRMLHTLENLGPAPEPNLTILWSHNLPQEFKDYACSISIDSSSIQFENDELMRPLHGDDYGIACCVSAMEIGKEMQFFGARCNLPKILLLAINEGRDEIDDELLVEGVPKLKSQKPLEYTEVKREFFHLIDWLCKKYVETMNVIHYSHDKYNYESEQMALHDLKIHRFMAFGIAGISIVIDSLSAIRYAKVTPVRNKKGVAKDFTIKGQYPAFGNDDDRADKMGIEITRKFIETLRKYGAYRNAEHTVSLLTITANVVYGHHTGATPDGRKAGEPFAPGANPMGGRDKSGALASLNSVAKFPYEYCRDGISNTFSITPGSLGKTDDQRINNLRGMMDGYFHKKGHHLNVNVLNRETLQDAMKNPAKYPQLTIRVSGYAVHFIKLTKEQQEEVISRTFHKNF